MSEEHDDSDPDVDNYANVGKAKKLSQVKCLKCHGHGHGHGHYEFMMLRVILKNWSYRRHAMIVIRM